MSEQNCGNCRFWWDKEDIGNSGTVPMGECRRSAPTTMTGSAERLFQKYCTVRGEITDESLEHADMAVWPKTRDWDWCGEHQPKTKAVQPETLDVPDAALAMFFRRNVPDRLANALASEGILTVGDAIEYWKTRKMPLVGIRNCGETSCGHAIEFMEKCGVPNALAHAVCFC